MGQTYEQHKVAVDAANPTPVMQWYQTTGHDNPLHSHDDEEVAVSAVTFMGTTHSFRVLAYISGNLISRWSVSGIGPDDEGGWGPFYATADTWVACKIAFTAALESWCEKERVLIAAEKVAHDIIADDGITAFPDSPVGTPATATLAGLMPHSATLTHWTLAPAFDADTLAYAFDSSNDTFVPVAELGFPGQTVYWKHGSTAYVGMAPVITLESGENIITITVISADGQNVKTYTLTVTRP